MISRPLIGWMVFQVSGISIEPRNSDPQAQREFVMKQGIHPKYEEITATCSCGNVIKVGSTLGKDINLDVCSACHPFFTGKQKIVDTGGRVDRFRKRFGARGKK